MKLIIIALLQQKINYLLNRFDIEWSGPAWFTFEKSKNGFPIEWKLEHFLPLDLGSHSETEWSGKHFMKISSKLYETHPELKAMYQGNIHSHHTMGAFFSTTDKELLRDAANDVGYPSLVVASSGKESHSFAISYLDQFRQPHIFEAKDIDIEYDEPVENSWITEANSIEKRFKKNKKKNQYSTKYDHSAQMSILTTGTKGINDYTTGVTDYQVSQELNRARTPQERFEMAIDAFETGFMDEEALNHEKERLGRTHTPQIVERITANYREERQNAEEINDWNSSFDIGAS